MNILGNNTARLNDIIFENRNKNYGAYVLRSEYNDALFKSLGLLGSFVAILFFSVYFYNRNHPQNPETKQGMLIPDIDSLVYTEVNMEPLKPVEPLVEQPSAAPRGFTTPIISDNTIVTSTLTIETPGSGLGPDDAVGTSSTSVVVTTNTMQAVQPSIPAVPDVVIIADEMPEFEGGNAGLMRYVAQNIVYPEVAKTIGQEGTVYVSFVVNENGVVESPKVMRGIGYGCDEEVLRVIGKMPRWKKGGKNSGHPVKVRFNIPVSFKIR